MIAGTPSPIRRRRDADVEFILTPRPRRGKPRKPEPLGRAPRGRIPRLARLMALAIKFDGMIRAGMVRDYAELARLGLVTRARMTQIMNLLNLAPDIQEEILFLPENFGGTDAVTERECRPLTAIARWDRQREMWRKLGPEQRSQPSMVRGI